MSYPSTWTKVKFGEIAKRKSVRISDPKNSGYDRYVGLEHLDSGELVVKRWGSSQDVSSSMQLFSKHHVLFARRNTYLRRVSVALFDGVCSGDIIVIEPVLKNIVDGFLPIYMQFEEFENRVIAWSAGAFSKRVKWKQLSDFEVWLPPKEDQQKIVDMIWSIQLNQEKSENLIQVAEKLKKGLLEELLTKGIGHKKFKKTELGEIPEEWDLLSLQEMLDKKIILSHLDGNHGSNYPRTKDFGREGVPYISATNLVDGRVDFSSIKFLSFEKAKQLTKGIAKNGDVLFAHNATVGPCAILETEEDEVILSTSLTYYRCNPAELSNVFLYSYMVSPKFQNQLEQYMKQTTRNQIPITTQRKLLFIKPSLKEQKEIESMLHSLTITTNLLKHHNVNIQKMKRKIANSLLSGNEHIPREVSE